MASDISSPPFQRHRAARCRRLRRELRTPARPERLPRSASSRREPAGLRRSVRCSVDHDVSGGSEIYEHSAQPATIIAPPQAAVKRTRELQYETGMWYGLPGSPQGGGSGDPPRAFGVY